MYGLSYRTHAHMHAHPLADASLPQVSDQLDHSKLIKTNVFDKWWHFYIHQCLAFIWIISHTHTALVWLILPPVHVLLLLSFFSTTIASLSAFSPAVHFFLQPLLLSHGNWYHHSCLMATDTTTPVLWQLIPPLLSYGNWYHHSHQHKFLQVLSDTITPFHLCPMCRVGVRNPTKSIFLRLWSTFFPGGLGISINSLQLYLPKTTPF